VMYPVSVDHRRSHAAARLLLLEHTANFRRPCGRQPAFICLQALSLFPLQRWIHASRGTGPAVCWTC